MSCFSSTRGALSPSSSLRPFAFKVSALCRHSLPWPCNSMPSAPILSECSKWYTARLDGMSRCLAKGFAPTSSALMSLPLESLRLLSSLAGRCYRSCFSSVGGARPCGSGALPPVLGFKDVYQPRGGGERDEPRLRLPHGLVPASSSSIRRKRMFTSLVKEANFGYAVAARPQAPPSAVLPAPWLGWSCPHPRRGDRGEDLFAMARMLRWSPPLGGLPGAEVVTAAGEAVRCRGGCLCWRAARS
jgi:hypothetical protein